MARWTRREWIAGAVACVAAGAGGGAGAGAVFSLDEVVDRGHKFFGAVSRGLAEAVQEAGRRWGLPNGYMLGQEASAAFVGGLRYGEGEMYTRNAGDRKVYWQGPSLGFDTGADGDRTMMLVYNLPAGAARSTSASAASTAPPISSAASASPRWARTISSSCRSAAASASGSASTSAISSSPRTRPGIRSDDWKPF